MIYWECGGIGHGWRECATPGPSNYLPLNQKLPALLQHQPGGNHHYPTTEEKVVVLMKLKYHNPNSGVRIWGRAKESGIEIDRWERKHH